jgi:hypothetical protein
MLRIIKAVLDYVKSFFKNPKPLQLNDIESQQPYVDAQSAPALLGRSQQPYNPMDDLPPMNTKAEREFAFRI